MVVQANLPKRSRGRCQTREYQRIGSNHRQHRSVAFPLGNGHQHILNDYTRTNDYALTAVLARATRCISLNAATESAV